jgi:hypothetical protein
LIGGYTILFSSALGTLAEISFSAQVVSLTVSGLRLLVALFGHGAMSELSPLSGVKLKSDFGAVTAAFDP